MLKYALQLLFPRCSASFKLLEVVVNILYNISLVFDDFGVLLFANLRISRQERV